VVVPETGGFNRWDERYRKGEYGDKAPEPLLVQIAAGLSPGRVLDVACGLGRNSMWLASQGWDVTAVDYSSVAVTILRERASEAGLRLDIVRADLEHNGFEIQPGMWDLICDTCFLHRPLFPAVREGLRPGGVFVGVYPLAGDDAAPRPTNPAYLMNPGELRALFRGWEILHDLEGRPGNDATRRLRAELAARKPLIARE
jgi:SAM-dependent methyltransferase